MCLVVAVGLLLVPGLLTSQPPLLTVLSRDSRRTLPLTVTNEQELVALDDLATMFQLAVREDSLGAITVSSKGKTIILTPVQALASVAGRLVSLPAPPVRASGPGGRWLVPVEFVSRALALVHDVRLELRKPSRLLLVGDVRVPRVAVRYEGSAAAARLIVDATPRTNGTVTQDNDHLTIKFDADALDVSNPPLTPPPAQPLVQALRLVDTVTLAVDLGPRFAGFRTSSSPIDNNTTRLVIDVVATETRTETAPPPALPAPPAPDLSALNPPASSIRTVVIDPGHGGNDEGAKGAGGANEKDLTLAVARKIKAAIEARLGIRVLLTRDDDRNVALDERTAVANNNKADLFISLHANASFRKSMTGASIFSAAFEADAEQAARAHLTPERLPTFGGGLRDIELVPWDLAQIPHVDRSIELAKVIEQELHNRIPLRTQPIESAPLRVLESANMPAVLVEMGFLSNPDQEKQLTGAAFQNTFVQALLDAVLKFRDLLDSGRQPPSAGGTQ